jgi:uncharacterized protein DUF3536/glycosyl hydrolase family 57
MTAAPTLHTIIHGHFYQPPREDPWIEEVETEPSAAPFHDWNERIEQECYRAVVAARISGHAGRILRIVNTLDQISFDFGPTLLEWMEQKAPETYAAILAADARSRTRLGAGNAVAMPYHHTILPLSSLREKIAEVRWGIADFRRRFGREPEGMWLPETAVDEETLEVLAGEGIRFTVLAPHQVRLPPPSGGAGAYRVPAGGSIAVFVYDGPLSHDVAFGPLVRDADQWAHRLLVSDPLRPTRSLVSLATDGETYGHHHPFAEMALALTLQRLSQTQGVIVDNYASYLAAHPPETEIDLISPSSWSCIHGVERWRSDCGCRLATDRKTQQAWRAPLRDGLGWLCAQLHGIFDREAPEYFPDPEQARLGYGSVVGATREASRAYVTAQARAGLSPVQLVRAAELLELERGALRSLTSCAWFFDDIGGIEALQVLRYVAWAIGLTGTAAAQLEAGFLRRLAPAESNDPSLGSGPDIYLQRARPHLPPEARIAAGLAAQEVIAPQTPRTGAYRFEGSGAERLLERRRTGRSLRSRIELEHLDQELAVSVRLEQGEELRFGLEDFPESSRTAVRDSLRRAALAELLTAEERTDVASGTELRAVVRSALLRATRALDQDASPEACYKVSQLVRFLARLGQMVPFEIQTIFYGIWKAKPDQSRPILGLAKELGFDVSGE